MGEKNNITTKSLYNKNGSVYYKKDHLYKVQEKRKPLKKELLKYKTEGKKATIQYDQLFLNDYNIN